MNDKEGTKFLNHIVLGKKLAGRKNNQFTTQIICEQYFHNHNFVKADLAFNENCDHDNGFYDIASLFQDKGVKAKYEIPK